MAKQSSTQYFYPQTGCLKKVTDTNGGSTQMTYDSMGRTLTKTFPNVRSVGTSKSYDYFSRPSGTTFANGTSVAFSTYDNMDNLTAMTISTFISFLRRYYLMQKEILRVKASESRGVII